MPMECQWTTNGLPLHVDVKIWISVNLIPLPPYMATEDRMRIPIQCQLRSITLDWHRFRIVRVPPLRNFWGTSRPMRSQHFKLSTNQKPWFRPDFRCWSNLRSTNSTPMCQLTENQVQLEYQLIADWQTLYWHWTNNGMPIDCQWNVNGLQMECQLRSNWMPIEIQSYVTWLQIEYQLTVNWMPINIQSYANRDPIWCQLTSNEIPIDCQSDANWDSIECKLRSSQMPIDIQWEGNWDPIGCKLRSNQIRI